MARNRSAVIWNITLAAAAASALVAALGAFVQWRLAGDVNRQMRLQWRELKTCAKAAADPSLLDLVKKKRDQGSRPAMGSPKALMGMVEKEARKYGIPTSSIARIEPSEHAVTKDVSEFSVAVDIRGLTRKQIVQILNGIQKEQPGFTVKKIKLVVPRKASKNGSDVWDLTFTLSRYYRGGS